MNKYIFTFVLFLTALFVSAQSKGDLFVGAGTDLASHSLTYLTINPGIGYQVDYNWQVGGTINWTKTDNVTTDWFCLNVKYYPAYTINDHIRSFIQVESGISFQEYWTKNSLRVGVTGFLTKRFYVEPTIGYTYSDYGFPINRLGMGLTCGLRI